MLRKGFMVKETMHFLGYIEIFKPTLRFVLLTGLDKKKAHIFQWAPPSWRYKTRIFKGPPVQRLNAFCAQITTDVDNLPPPHQKT